MNSKIRRSKATLPDLLIFLSLFLCACSPAASPEYRPSVTLRLAGAPADANVVIDEQEIGTFDYVAARGVALLPGVHHITVKAHGYFPWDREVEAKLGGPPLRLKVALIPVPD
jgi:hypothetical protein